MYHISGANRGNHKRSEKPTNKCRTDFEIPKNHMPLYIVRRNACLTEKQNARSFLNDLSFHATKKNPHLERKLASKSAAP